MQCWYCECILVPRPTRKTHRAWDKRTKTRDHKTPRIKGGLDTDDNLVDACMRCNSSKNDSTTGEFIARLLLGLSRKKFNEMSGNYN